MPDIFDQIHSEQPQASRGGDIFDQIHSESQNPAAIAPVNQPDMVEQALNYHTGNGLIDAPLGALQGLGKGVMSTAIGAGKLFSKFTGQPLVVDGRAITPEDEAQLATPNGVGQGTGKFLEQAGEFALPAGLASKGLKGAGLLARLAAQAGIGAGVSAAQTGGDPTATVLGGALGGGGELAGAAMKGFSSLLKNKALNLQNYSDAFAATPTQKAELSKALPSLVRDGVKPGATPVEMQDAVKSRLGDLGDKYKALPSDIGQRSIDPATLISDLKAQQAEYGRVNPATGEITVASSHQPYFDKIQSEIEDVRKLAEQNGGKIAFDDVKYLRDGANGRTNFASPEADQNIYRGIGNAYRRTMDSLAPETTQLNKDWATYKNLQALADKNVSYGRGITQSGLAKFGDHLASRGVGAGVGASIGLATGIPGASEVGAVLGGMAGPKLAAPVTQALRNAVDNGSFVALSSAKQNAIKGAMRIGDNKAVMRMLGAIPKATVTQSLAPDSSNNPLSQFAKGGLVKESPLSKFKRQ